MDIEIFYNKTELRAENDEDEKLLKWIEFRLPLIVKRHSRMMISIKEDIKIKGVQLKIQEKSEEYNRLKQCEKCLFEYTKNLVCYKGGYRSIDQKEPCLLFKPKKENNCKIESELDPEKKICKICNKQIVESSFAYTPNKQHYLHTMCIEKLKLLFKIRKSNALNSVDFKSLEIIFGVLIDEIPNEIIQLYI